ncbi:MAG: hypothetical protein MJ211_14620 [Bacteroidales bacterium]|nr:hypothetical protein [Bacteroidales bacterium]
MKRIITILEITTLILLGYIIYFKCDNILNVLYMIATCGLVIFYCLNITIKTNQNKPQNENYYLNSLKKISFMSLSTLLIGILFKIEGFPGNKTMLMVGLFGCSFSALIFFVKKEIPQDNVSEENQLPFGFSKIDMLPRLIISLLLGIYIWVQGENIVLYKINQDLINNLTENSNLSQDDAKMVSAWYDIFNGNIKDKVLKQNEISETDYNAKAEALVYGNKENIPENLYVDIINIDDIQSIFYDMNIDTFLNDYDTTYIHSLRPIFYKYLDSYDKMKLDMKNLSKHTTNEEFINFVRQEIDTKNN